MSPGAAIDDGKLIFAEVAVDAMLFAVETALAIEHPAFRTVPVNMIDCVVYETGGFHLTVSDFPIGAAPME